MDFKKLSNALAAPAITILILEFGIFIFIGLLTAYFQSQGTMNKTTVEILFKATGTLIFAIILLFGYNNTKKFKLGYLEIALGAALLGTIGFLATSSLLPNVGLCIILSAVIAVIGSFIAKQLK